MTKKPQAKDKSPRARELSGFFIDGKRSSSGLTVAFGKILSISQYSEELVELLSHGGRIVLRGRRLKLCVYEGGTVEVAGRIEEISFTYGKN